MGVSTGWSLARRSFLGILASSPFLGKTLASSRTNRDAYVEQNESTVTIGNDQIELTVQKGNGGIEQLRAIKPDLRLCDSSIEREAKHWRLTFYSDEYEELRAESVNAKSTTIRTSEEPDRVVIVIEWTDPEIVSPSEGVIGRFEGTIQSRIVVESSSPLIQWHFNVQNRGGEAIKTASCPYITRIGPLDTAGNDELVLPQLIGKRIRNPASTGPDGISYPAGTGTMQFTSYTTDAGGFYTDARDVDGFAKELSWESSGDTLEYLMRHYAPRRFGADLSIPYTATVGAIVGDWYDAADRYRAWLFEHGWLSTDQAGLPNWIHERGAFFELTSYTRPNFPDPLPELPYRDVVDLMGELTSIIDAPLELRWRGWQTHGRKHGLDWFPPKEGVEAFESAITELHDLDVRVSSMISGSFGYEFSDFWQENRERAESWVIQDENERLVEMDYAPGHPEDNILYKIEFPQRGYQLELRKRLKKFAQVGADSINLDGFPWHWVADCYAEDHEHPVGMGGNWFPKNSRLALRELKEVTRSEHPGFIVSGEGLSDYYFPYLQIGYYRSAAPERHLEIRETDDVDLVPVLPYTLGDFHAILAATIFVRGNFEYQRLAIARAFVSGSIPAVNMDFPPDDLDGDVPTLDYLGRAARARSRYANRFIARGRMLRSPSIDVSTVTMETATVAPGDETATVWTPEILTNAWQSDRGETGFVFANVSPETETITIDLDIANQPMPLPEQPWLIYSVKNGGYELIDDTIDETSSITLDINQSDVVLLVFSADGERRRLALETLIEAQTVATKAETQFVERAKRRFEQDQLDECLSIAQTVIDEDVTPTDLDSRTDRFGDGTTPTTTSADAPGFTFLTGFAGAAAAVATLLRIGSARLTHNEDD